MDTREEEQKKIMCSFFEMLMLSSGGCPGNKWTHGLEIRAETGAGDAMSHQNLYHMGTEVVGVDETGQEMVSREKSPRKASKEHEHLRDRLKINFSQKKPKDAREIEKEPGDSGPKEESFKKKKETNRVKWAES